MTNLVNNLKVNDTVVLNGREYTVDSAPTQATHCVMVGIKGKRGTDMVLCWYPEVNGGKFFSFTAMSRATNIKTMEVK